MNDLISTVATFGKPYTVTRSRLAVITKVYDDKYICDIDSLKQIFELIAEKLSSLTPKKEPEFSFLISFSDKTHQDGLTPDFTMMRTLSTGKTTDRIVMRWKVIHDIQGEDNELSITIRISNPINPLIFLQAALSKSPSEVDNVEFEMDATCVTVDGADQSYSDEVFLRVQNWINARNKPYSFMQVSEFYSKYDWYVDQFNRALLPLLLISLLSIFSSNELTQSSQITIIPIVVGLFFFFQSIAYKINSKMAHWAARSKHIGLFQVSNGDVDALSKMAAKVKNGAIKLVATGITSLTLNIGAAVLCWWLLPK